MLFLTGLLCVFADHSRAEAPDRLFSASEALPTIQVVRYDAKTADPYAGYTIPGSSFAYSDIKLAFRNTIAAFVLPPGLPQLGRDAELSQTVGSLGPQLPDLDKILATQLEQKMGVSSASRIKYAIAVEGQPKILLSPHALLAADKEGQIALTFYLEAKALDKSGNRTWWNRYFFKPETKRYLLGLDGWLGDSGALSSATGGALQMMLTELQVNLNSPENTQTKDVRFKTCMGGERNSNVLLRETPEYYVTKKDLGRIYGPTTFILLKSTCQLAEPS